MMHTRNLSVEFAKKLILPVAAGERKGSSGLRKEGSRQKNLRECIVDTGG